MSAIVYKTKNCQSVLLQDIPICIFDDFRNSVLIKTRKGLRVVSFFGVPEGSGKLKLYIVLANDRQGELEIISTLVSEEFPSLTLDLPQVHLFEREIFEEYGVCPKGHPWLKPVRKGLDKRDYFKVEGESVHEVAVGPVHAGIIEPGHFRFQCHGEKVFHLEIFLGYQHRGIERKLASFADKKNIHYMETLAGDTTIGHTLAYCQGLENLSNMNLPLRGLVIRGILLELERLANHTGDLGALANDIGYLPTSAYCGRLRGDFLNMTALICGNRFGRNVVRLGGVDFDLTVEMITELKKRLKRVFSDLENAVSLLWESSFVLERFEETGVIEKKTALNLGLVGVAARACGIERDVRFDFPAGIFKLIQIPVSIYSSGDVFSRAFVRWLEIQRSVKFIEDQLSNLPRGEINIPLSSIQGREEMVVSLVEGWRGEICHVLLKNENAEIIKYKITDPSFHNWMGLSVALRGEEISDFPLCNKSFNLSYCGHDL